MITRNTISFLILVVLFLPLPFIISLFLFGVLFTVRPRGEPDGVRAVLCRFAGPTLLRSPPL